MYQQILCRSRGGLFIAHTFVIGFKFFFRRKASSTRIMFTYVYVCPSNIIVPPPLAIHYLQMNQFHQKCTMQLQIPILGLLPPRVNQRKLDSQGHSSTGRLVGILTLFYAYFLSWWQGSIFFYITCITLSILLCLYYKIVTLLFIYYQDLPPPCHKATSTLANKIHNMQV